MSTTSRASAVPAPSKPVSVPASRVRPLAAAAPSSSADNSWALLYGAITSALKTDPKKFQLVYPFTSWDWPVENSGYVSAAEFDFVSNVPQWSAAGAYVSSGVKFHEAYQSMLNAISLSNENPQLEQQLRRATDLHTKASNAYNIIRTQALAAYKDQVGNNNTPTFTEWLASDAGHAWNSQLQSSQKSVDATQAALDDLTRQSNTPGLIDARNQFADTANRTQLMGDEYKGFPSVPAYSIDTDATSWLDRAKAGQIAGGTIKFSNSDSAFDYRNSWAGGSVSVTEDFWQFYANGSWQRIDEFYSDNELSVTINFKAWDTISIDPGPWYSSGFVKQIRRGPFADGYSAYGDGNTQAVWGQDGIMSLQKVGMLVCYKPSFTIKVSSSCYQSFYQKWQVCGGLRIGSFEISGGGGDVQSDWKANGSSFEFSGDDTSDGAMIFGVNINAINPPA